MFIPEAIRAGGRPFVSVELLPPRSEAEQEGFWLAVEAVKAVRPLFAAVTCGAGGRGAVGTAETAGILAREHGLTVMPHLTCVHEEPSGLPARLEALQGAGIRNVLAVRGDFPTGETARPGGFAHASDLVARVRRLAPDIAVGVAAYPDGHPDSRSLVDDIAFLKFKLDQGADFAVTQLFFDNRRYFDMVDRLAATGCHKPVIPSVLPVRGLGQIKRVAALCDAPVPGKILAAMEAAHAKNGDQGVRRLGVSLAAAQVEELLRHGAPGVHLYPFNRADLCLEVVERAGLLP
ncbi:5,10-methylenetetrahydrofolate reductase [Pseudodesulfovibrio sp. F-1]|uniref:Methylenetetrahydrofolate reductase n=1 Tax=Pseudodesulfovibrio alkaliphilus TaxID=2661613 RepID=A0A7K1KN11_9BACT|nr:methylenetetrahydrofolate reductase [Pseudodesulfovibrio alkaliphilus]MUM77468.1 5,10-methylenetetrahydrofolate reductase [Pseudodesulfovibrio alkaliphilus]